MSISISQGQKYLSDMYNVLVKIKEQIKNVMELLKQFKFLDVYKALDGMGHYWNPILENLIIEMNNLELMKQEKK